jgi:hypothetical protein
MASGILLFLRSKAFLYLIALAGVCALVYGAYDWAYTRGSQSREPEIATLVTQRDSALNEVRVAYQKAKAQKVAYDAALTIMRADALITEKALKDLLDKSQAREKKLKENLNAIIPQYVSAKADAGCTVPAGFVRLHNLSAKGLDPSDAAEASRVPGSGSETADSPTTLKLSDIGRTVANNYGECQSRLEIIEGWQLWYTRSLESWKKAVEMQANYTIIPTPE